MRKDLSRFEIRQLLERRFVTDSEFSAFCIDYFPTVYQNFTEAMSRQEKINILLHQIEPDTIMRHLRDIDPLFSVQPTEGHDGVLAVGDSLIKLEGYKPLKMLFFGVLLGATMTVAIVAFLQKNQLLLASSISFLVGITAGILINVINK